jgi:SAM-dependent methyltransferase
MTDQRHAPKMAFFSSSHYKVHNEARLRHLASLNLPLQGRVLEVGAGPGDHTGFYVDRNCTVVSTDAREECIAEIKSRYPQVEVLRVDMNQPDPLADLGMFDIIHCYGLLYHLEVPERAIAAMSQVCRNLLLLETCVSPGPGEEINPTREVLGDYTQAMSGHACRPTRSWVFNALKRYFPYVYQTRTQPVHPEFPIDWTAIPPDHGLIRIVLVASKHPCDFPVLSSELLDHQERLPFVTRAEVEVRDEALEDMRRQLERANERAAMLEATAAERLKLLESVHREAEALRGRSTIKALLGLK